MDRATDVDTRVIGPCSEDQQTEETDGESTPQVTAVRDPTGVQQLVAMVIGQGSGLLWAAQMFPKEPHNCLDLKHRENKMTKILLLVVDNVVLQINTRDLNDISSCWDLSLSFCSGRKMPKTFSHSLFSLLCHSDPFNSLISVFFKSCFLELSGGCGLQQQSSSIITPAFTQLVLYKASRINSFLAHNLYVSGRSLTNEN